MRSIPYTLLTGTLLAAILLPPASYAQIQTEARLETSYGTSYEIEDANAIKPVTVALEYHVYNPGDEVRVTGSVWSAIVEQIESLDLVKIEIKDGQGNVVAREDASLDGSGDYSTTLKLLDSANTGTYAVESRVELEADALGVVEALTSAALRSSMQFAVAEPTEHPVTAEGRDFQVMIASNSGINDFKFNQEEKRVSFFVEGNDGTKGITEITIPKVLLSGDMKVFLDQNLMAEEDVIVKSDTETETTFEINYSHSIHRMEVTGTSVIPEFTVAFMIMTAAIASIIVMTVVARKRGFFAGPLRK